MKGACSPFILGGISDAHMTRRRFVRDAAAIASVTAGSGLLGTVDAGARRRRRGPTTVAVLGGGIAGLTAAHELAERGFDVSVYERRAWGGKARSTEVPGSAAGGRRPLPGEHSWRIFAGFYENTIDTMRRIPFGTNAGGVADNLVGDDHFLFARAGGRRDVDVTIRGLGAAGASPEFLVTLLSGCLVDAGIPPAAAEHYVGRLVVFLASCDARRVGQWEHTTWTDFADADAYGEDYRRILIDTFSEIVQSSKAERTSALFPCHVLEWMIYNGLGRASNGPILRSLNAPTNEAFIDPWLATLRRHGVRLRLGTAVTRLLVDDGRIVGALVRRGRRTTRITADWFVCALPVERARRLWSPGILAADPHLGRMWRLDTAWMNGMKFFLDRERPITRGHVDYVDSPWQVSSVSQAQFWPVDFAATYGDGRAREALSVVISNWTADGVLFGKPARDCTPEEVAAEVWEQMKRHLNDPGRPAVLTDDLIVSWDIDPGMTRRRGRLVSDDPMVLPTVGQRPDRPDVTTGIPNLLLCGDYLKSAWEVATMEAASFNGRRAANALLERSGSREPASAAIGPVRPPEWEALKRVDEDRWRRGLPNVFDRTMEPGELRTLLTR